MDTRGIIQETRKALAEKNALGRFSTWPIPLEMAMTSVGGEYAIKWMNGEVPKTGIDEKVLEECIRAYVREYAGEEIEASVTSLSYDGKTYENFKMILLGYLTY